MEVRDSNGTILNEGDSVMIIKSLKVKGSQSDLKRGQVVKNIRFTNDPGAIEGKVDKVTLVLKTEFLKKM
jgi:protein PhnA